jgi:hypothetical protein
MLPDDALAALTVPVAVAIGVVQAGSPGAYSANATEPEGENPPVSMAWLEMTPSAGAGPDAMVAMAGAAFETATDSLPHGDVAESLSGSPLYVATHR